MSKESINLLGGFRSRQIMYAKNQLKHVNQVIDSCRKNPDKYAHVLSNYYDWKTQIELDLKILELT